MSTTVSERVDVADADLLAAHIAGDADAFGQLVLRHQGRLWAVALRTLSNPEDAADALQEAYVSAFRRAETVGSDAQVTTWLHRVVVNACQDRIRRNQARAPMPLPAVVDQPSEVASAWGELNPDQRAALVLVDREGYSVTEAAMIMGCATGTIKSRCARGRARLVLLLNEEGQDEVVEDGSGPELSADHRS